jgi:hypothetical protein
VGSSGFFRNVSITLQTDLASVSINSSISSVPSSKTGSEPKDLRLIFLVKFQMVAGGNWR